MFGNRLISAYGEPPVCQIPASGMMRVPVRLYASGRLFPSEQEIGELERIARLKDVAQIVALPDLHLKPRLETPSSTATATRENIILSLTSPSAGCGMALAATGLHLDDLDEGGIDGLMGEISRSLPLRAGGQPLAVRDARPFLIHGAQAAAEYFGMDSSILDSIERNGDALGSLAKDELAVLASLPEWALGMAAQDFGYIGRGNHFFELQVVDEVLDEGVARLWGVAEGQVVVMYHADSGRLGALAGRLYANRLKNTPSGRWREVHYKTAFHLRQADTLSEVYRRWAYYFRKRRHLPIPAESELAQTALRAIGAASNYASANRLAILHALGEGLRAVWGESARLPRLVYDVSHNSIQAETLAGEILWVHRHNASRALPPRHPSLADTPYFESGQPSLLPGTDRTHSFLLAARPGTARSLFSLDHGAGRSAARLARMGTGEAHTTRLYDFQRGYVEDRPNWTSDGVDEVLTILRLSDLAAPVARLRPLATLKDAPV